MRKRGHWPSSHSHGPHGSYGSYGSYGSHGSYGSYGSHGPGAPGAMYQQPVAPQPERRRGKVVWHRVWGTGCLLLSLGLVFLGVGVFLSLPDKLDDQRAYAAAEPCQGEAATSREQAMDEPCLHTFTATVIETRKSGRDSSGRQYKVTVRTAEDDSRLLGRFDDEPLGETLQPNQTLTVVTYRDRAVELTQGTITQQATGTPATKPVANTVLGISMFTMGGWLFYLGLSAVASARGLAWYGPRAVLPRIGGPFAITLLLPMTLAIPTQDIAGSQPFFVILAGWCATLVITLLGFRKRIGPHWDKA